MVGGGEHINLLGCIRRHSCQALCLPGMCTAPPACSRARAGAGAPFQQPAARALPRRRAAPLPGPSNQGLRRAPQTGARSGAPPPRSARRKGACRRCSRSACSRRARCRRCSTCVRDQGAGTGLRATASWQAFKAAAADTARRGRLTAAVAPGGTVQRLAERLQLLSVPQDQLLCLFLWIHSAAGPPS